MASQFGDWERRMRAQAIQNFDQEFQELRSTYSFLKQEERKAFATWLAKIVKAISERPDIGIHFAIRASLDNSVSNSEGDIVYEGSCTASPRLMLQAIEAWDRGEEFAPRFGEIIGGDNK